MEELKEKIDKMEKDIKSIAANQEGLKEKMQNNNTLLKNDLVLVERRLDDKLDIMSKKLKKHGWQNEYHNAKHKHLNTDHEHHDTKPEYNDRNVKKTKVWYKPYQ